MADYNLANWNRALPPEMAQQIQADMLRQRANPRIADAMAEASQYDDLAAVAQIANNPELAAAASNIQKSTQARFAPERMGTQGFMLPNTGEFIESPIYKEEKQAARAASREAQQERLAAQRELADARLEHARMFKEASLSQSRELRLMDDRRRASEGELNRALRLQIAEMAAGRKLEDQAAKDERELDKAVIKLKDAADKKQVPRLMMAGSALAQALKKSDAAGDAPIPGFGYAEKLASQVPFGDSMLSPEAKANISASQEVLNALMKADAGLSQTQQEALRQDMALMQSAKTGTKTKKQILRERILPLLNVYRSSTLGAFPAAVRGRYASQQQELGGDTSWMDAIDFGEYIPPLAPGEKVISKKVK